MTPKNFWQRCGSGSDTMEPGCGCLFKLTFVEQWSWISHGFSPAWNKQHQVVPDSSRTSQPRACWWISSRKLALVGPNAILPLSRRMPRIGRPFNQSFRNKVFEYMEKFKKSEDAEFSRNDVRRAAKFAISEEPFVHDVYLRQLKFSTGWCRLILSHINKKQSSAALKSPS